MVATKLVSLGATLALAAAVAASPAASYRALRARDYKILDLVPIDKRQDVSPERFQCHSDCGNTILDSEADGYCESSAWRGLLDACLECVVEHPIWQWYGEEVQAAAAGCDLSAEPGSPATPIGGGGDNDDDETTSEAQPSPTQPTAPPAETTTDTPATTTTPPPQETDSNGEDDEEEEDDDESAAPSYTVPSPSHAPAPSNGTEPTPSHIPSAAGARVGGSFFAAGVLAAAVYIL